MLLFGLLFSSVASAETEITVWTFGTLIYPDEILEDFRQETGTRVYVDVRPWGDRTEGLSVAIAGGVAPDLVYLNNDFVPIFQSIGALESFDRYMPQSFIDDYPSGYMDSLVIEGQRWQWPLFEAPYNVLINVDLFESVGLDPHAPPVEWQEIAQVGEKLVRFDDTGTPIRSGISFSGGPTSTQLGWQQLLFQFGGELFAPDLDRVAFDSEESVRSLEFMIDLRERGIAHPLNWSTGNSGMAMFTAQAPLDTRSGEPRVDFEWRWGNVPKEKRQITVGSNGGYVMLADSDHKDEAAAFLKYITQPDIQKKILNRWGFISVRRSIQPEDYGPNHWWVRQLIQATAPYFELRGQNHERTINQQFLSPLVWEAWEGKMSATNALQEASRRSNAYLQEARSK